MTTIPANDPIGPVDLRRSDLSCEGMRSAIRHNGGLCTDGPVEPRDFRGWGWRGARATHWWRAPLPMLGPGNIPHCARCVAQFNKGRR